MKPMSLMPRSSCYRRNLATPLLSGRPVVRARTNASEAMLAAFLCAAACFGLVACGKSATQYIERGNQLFAAGHYGDATLNYRNALKKSPDSGEAYYRLGLSLLKQNRWGKPIKPLVTLCH